MGMKCDKQRPHGAAQGTGGPLPPFLACHNYSLTLDPQHVAFGQVRKERLALDQKREALDPEKMPRPLLCMSGNQARCPLFPYAALGAAALPL